MRPIACLLLFSLSALAQEYGQEYRLKIPITGETRKGVLFIPKTARKNDALPLLVAIPDTRGKAMLELGQWQQPGYDRRFAVFSVDVVTSSERGWHPSEQLEMARDMEAVTEGLKMAFSKAEQVGFPLDRSAVVMTGHSGGTYLTLWMGIRHPELFLGISGRSCVFFKETVQISETENVQTDFDLPIFIYRGETDHPRAKKSTELASKTLKAAGYTKVEYRIVPGMKHESKPEIFIDWFVKLLRTTEKGRKEARKPGVYGKIAKLVEREKKSGFKVGVSALLDVVNERAEKEMRRAEDLEADFELFEAAKVLKQVTKDFAGLEVAKEARERRSRLMKSDEYKAAEMLRKAQGYIDKDKREKGFDLLQKLLKKYPGTVAAERAEGLLQG